jgi:hypothetical protein
MMLQEAYNIHIERHHSVKGKSGDLLESACYATIAWISGSFRKTFILRPRASCGLFVRRFFLALAPRVAETQEAAFHYASSIRY